ncbi:conserved hypothetical protein (DUF1651) [Synechococcus sp. MIT S9220]|nr:DUF1651 domain-containing protein [Synechococcus sp. MIT S9220]NOL47458.1 DUF1651 domain-containing protein [Synechococcus sp. MIT S9220]QNJ22187.1 conserved hypothetical protein (DUF1651) [Synechococcus sp. MIT S9220]
MKLKIHRDCSSHKLAFAVKVNKDRLLVDRHAPKNGVGWLRNDQEGKVCSFTNANPTTHAQWVFVETRPLRRNGQPVIRRMLRHNAIEAWETMQNVFW